MKQHRELAIVAEHCPNCGVVPLHVGHRCIDVDRTEDPCARCGAKVTDGSHREECEQCPFCRPCCEDLGRADLEAPFVKTFANAGLRAPLKNIHVVDLYLRVNGLHLEFVWLRDSYSQPGEVELLVEDPEIGPILLDDTFEIEMRAAPELQWRKVSYEEAKESIDAAFDAFGPSKNAIGKPEIRFAWPAGDSLPVVPNLASVRRVQEVLYWAGVPSLVSECADNRTLAPVAIMVPRLLKSKIWLRRAGFYIDREHTSVLHDPETGLTIELVEKVPTR